MNSAGKFDRWKAPENLAFPSVNYLKTLINSAGKSERRKISFYRRCLFNIINNL